MGSQRPVIGPETQAAFARFGRDMTRAFEHLAGAAARIGDAIRSAFLPRLVVDDPYDRTPTNAGELAQQMRDIVLHEFWMAADRPERSPGARWVRR